MHTGYVQSLARRRSCETGATSHDFTTFTSGLYNHFNNLHFSNIWYASSLLFVSSEHPKCRLLKRLSDHPMKHATGLPARLRAGRSASEDARLKSRGEPLV